MTGNFMNEYIEKLNRESNITKYNELEEYAKVNKVPIIQYDSLIYLLTIIRLKKVTRILEIGTAIAYSSLQMANMSDDIVIDTIERDDEMYDIAKANVEKYNKQAQIKIHHSDALMLDLNELKSEYDLIFIDAAKAQYQNFFNRFSPLLSKNGVIVTDNILFHGCVEMSTIDDSTLSKNVKHMAKKIDAYNKKLTNEDEFQTFYFECGDGLAITVRK